MEKFMKTMRKFYTTAWPYQLTIDSSWLRDLTQTIIGVRFLVYHDGDKAELEKLINEDITDGNTLKPLIKSSLEEPSSLFLHETLDKDKFFHWDQGVRHPAGELKTENNATLRLILEDSLFTESLESIVVDEREFYTSKTAPFNVAMSSFEHISDNRYERDEPPLANQLASRQW
ncbi:hypothetical protein LI328DRAFT_163330 [Trichoderma asperelloides]|nr:hypothetical protein LI328DRAFT_163330 [Trichoderma asperelloides]